jgi:L-ascorbate 6-phosphate lactonase
MTMKITWLGQGGYLIEQAGKRLVVDPYLTDALAASHNLRRLAPPPLGIDELAPDTVFITHDHLDHFDPETLTPLLRRWPDCLLAGPKSVIAHARHLGVRAERLVEICVGQPVSLSGFTILPTPAKHSDPCAVGLLIDGGEKLVYISGDTLYDVSHVPMVVELASKPIDVAMICINGKLGNMNLTEAADLAAELQPAIAVPMHYGLFQENTADPHEFVAACERRGQNTHVLQMGETMQL